MPGPVAPCANGKQISLQIGLARGCDVSITAAAMEALFKHRAALICSKLGRMGIPHYQLENVL